MFIAELFLVRLMYLGSHGSGDYAKGIAALRTFHSHQLDWKTSSVLIEVATSFDDNTPMEIDLTKTLETGKRQPRKSFDVDGVYWLSKEFNEGGDLQRKTTPGDRKYWALTLNLLVARPVSMLANMVGRKP